MGANSTQAAGLLVLLVGFTALAGAFAGGGMIVGILAVALIVGSAVIFMKVKPLEHRE